MRVYLSVCFYRGNNNIRAENNSFEYCEGVMHRENRDLHAVRQSAERLIFVLLHPVHILAVTE